VVPRRSVIQADKFGRVNPHSLSLAHGVAMIPM
jgi:hypothetical protein